MQGDAKGSGPAAKDANASGTEKGTTAGGPAKPGEQKNRPPGVAGAVDDMAQRGKQLADKAGRQATARGLDYVTAGASKAARQIPVASKVTEKIEGLGGRVAVATTSAIALIVVMALLAVGGVVGTALFTGGSGGRGLTAPAPTAQQCALMPDGWCAVVWAAAKSTSGSQQPVPWSVLAGLASRSDFGRGANLDGIDRTGADLQAPTNPAGVSTDPEATAAVASPAPARIAGAAAPSRARAEVPAAGGSPQKPPASTGPATPAPKETPKTPALLVGDSLSVGVYNALLKDSKKFDWMFRGEVGKPTSWGADQIQTLADAGRVPPLVVIELGTNPSPSIVAFTQDATRILKALQGKRVYWLTHHAVGDAAKNPQGSASNATKYDAVLDGLRKKFPGLTLIDAAAQVKAHPDWVASDPMRIHLTGEGYRQRAALIEASIGSGSGPVAPVGGGTVMTDDELEQALNRSISDTSCPVAPVTPPIRTAAGEEGPFLLTPKLAAEMASRGRNPQSACSAALFIADRLASTAVRLMSTHPDREKTIDGFTAYWVDVLVTSEVLADPALSYTRSCLGAPDTLDVGQQIAWTFGCVASRSGLTPVTVTSMLGSDVTSIGGHKALQQLAREASVVAWNWSKWGKQDCDPRGVRAGLFPLTRAQARQGGAKDRCDPAQSMRAAARLVLAREAVELTKRRPGWEQMIGGWDAIPYVLGTTRKTFLLQGPISTWTPAQVCNDAVGAWLDQASVAWDAQLVTNAERLEKADGLVGEDGVQHETQEFVLDEIGDLVESQFPLPSGACGMDRATAIFWLQQAAAGTGEGATNTPGWLAMIAWLQRRMLNAPHARPGTDSLVERLAISARVIDSPPTSQVEADIDSLGAIAEQVMQWAVSAAGGPTEGEWPVTESTCVPTFTVLSGDVKNVQTPSSEQVAATIYAQAMGLGLGQNAARVGIFVAAAESRLDNHTYGPSDTSHFRGAFQQSPSWVPKPYKAWSGQRFTPETAGDFGTKEAWRPGGWALSDPRMNVALAANMFFTGPAYNRKEGLEDSVVFRRFQNATLDARAAVQIAHDVQGFSLNDMDIYASVWDMSQEYYAKIVAGKIPVPPFVDDGPTTGRDGTQAPGPEGEDADSVMSPGYASGCMDPEAARSIGAILDPVAGATPLPRRDSIVPAFGYSLNIPGGRNMTYYSQWDSRWATTPGVFSGGTIQGCGCGPTSFAMIASTLTGTPVSPVEAAHLQKQLGGLNSCGTGAWVFDKMAARYGLKTKVVGTNLSEAIRVLRSGGMLMASMNGPIFTSKQHYIVIRGVTSTGRLLVANSIGPVAKGTGNSHYVQQSLDRSFAATAADFNFHRGMIAIWK